MEAWLIITLISLCLSLFFKFIFNTNSSPKTKNLPPAPLNVPIVSNFLWLKKPFAELEPTLKKLHKKHGPIVTLHMGSRPAIFIADRFMAHQALVQNASVFSDRPKAIATNKIISSNQCNVNTASYGPIWRLLRRNLASEVLHPSRIELYSSVRKWVLNTLLSRLKTASELRNLPVRVNDHFQHALFCLLLFMCFGEKLQRNKIKQIEGIQRKLLLSFDRFKVLNFWPLIGRFVFHKRWEEFFYLHKAQEELLIPLIQARKKTEKERESRAKEKNPDGIESIVSYTDTLLDLELPEENRKLTESEMVSLCSEFLNSGTDTTVTALEWIMANLVKYPSTQERLMDDIKRVMCKREGNEVKEEDLQKMPYLKAVILEGLRRHPPAHFLLPHAVTEDVVFNNYLLPKNGSVNFLVAEISRDPNVWDEPMCFKPERFLSSDGSECEVFDIMGKREIKMMPFGAGRRICPGYGLAMLHLEYLVANLIWNFEWKCVGEDVDLSEKQEFTMVMKTPLEAILVPRLNKVIKSNEDCLD